MTKLPWYAVAFGADYLDRYSHRDDSEARMHIEAFLSVAGERADAPVLDLCCGAGRHLVALAEHGIPAIGFDLSCALLGRARARLKTSADTIQLVRGDMRRLPFAAQSIGAVCHWFTAFGYFEDDGENLDVFGEAARVLRPGGVYLFDFLCADAVRAELADGAEGKGLSPDGRRVWKEVVRCGADGSPAVLRESVRLFGASELSAALEDRGFDVDEVWGDYDRSPWRGADSPRWIAVCRKRG